MISTTTFLVFFFLCVLTTTAFATGDVPPVFDKRAYGEAKQAAKDGKKWFIVKSTAAWCAPCKQMDKTTWVDEKVVGWLKDNAVAVVIDVDEDPDRAEELAVRAMPTMIAFKDGEEFDRIVGYRGPDEFLTWLTGIAAGEKSIETTRRRVGARPKEAGEKGNMQQRLQLADELAASGQVDEAVDEYIWLWDHMLEHERAMYGVRLSFMAGDMERLAGRSDKAKKAFIALRDRTGEQIAKEKVDPDDLVDWVTLNKIVDDSGATLAWYDRVKDQARWRPLINRVDDNLEELFIESGRWADLGRLHGDPIEFLERQHEFFTMMKDRGGLPAGVDEETRKFLADSQVRRFREQVASVYAGLLAADREPEAAAYSTRAREIDADPGMAVVLVEKALLAGQPREAQVAWLEVAADDPAVAKTLRSLREGLAKRPK